MQKWFRILIIYIRKGHSASIVAASSPRQKAPSAAIPSTQSERTLPGLLIWTKEEADLAWKEKRTEVNLASILSEKVNAVQSCSGSFMVDGKPTRVVICVDDSAKRWLLEATKQRVLSRGGQVGTSEKEKQKTIEGGWSRNGCLKDSSGQWEVPDELMWRSLPRGEDR